MKCEGGGVASGGSVSDMMFCVACGQGTGLYTKSTGWPTCQHT